ncbi:mucin-17-like [Argopecten irradians]|uniref:mucin-17-like n=1 Tax=Argopecten irradians TaxID=31199 RepID=UPI0037228F92
MPLGFGRMEKISKYEISPLIALLNMIKVNYFEKNEIYRTLLAILCDYDTRNPAIKEKTKHYIQLLLADHQDLAKTLITFLPGEASAESIPLGQSPITSNVPAVNHKRHKKSRHKSKKKSKHKSKSIVLKRLPLVTLLPDLETPPKQSTEKEADTHTKPVESSTLEISKTNACTQDSVSPGSSHPQKVKNRSSKGNLVATVSKIIRSKSPVFTSSSISRKPLQKTTSVHNESKSLSLPFSMFDSCGFPLKNVCETGQQFPSHAIHRQISETDVGKQISKKNISHQSTAEVKPSEVPTPTPHNKPGNICTPTFAVPPYHTASMMMPLYNLSRNTCNVSDQANYPTPPFEPFEPSLGFDHLPFNNTGVPVSTIHGGTDHSVLVPTTLPIKASLNQNNGYPNNFIHRPEAVLLGHTPKVYNPVQWATRFEQFSSMTVGKAFHSSGAGDLQPSPIGQVPVDLTTHHPPVPHLYTVPKTSASFAPGHTEQHAPQLSLAKSPLHHNISQTTHSAGKTYHLGTNSNLSGFPYTRQMVLPDGQTQNLYLKRSSVNIPDISGVSENLQKSITSGPSYSYQGEQGNSNFPNQNGRNMIPTNRGENDMLKHMGDARHSLQAPVPFFIADNHLSKLQHPDNLLDPLGGRGDADVLEALPKPRKVTMSANSSVRKKLRLTPKGSIRRETIAPE